MRVDPKHMAMDILAMAKEFIGYEFPSQDALDKYLKDHPKAKKDNHWVKNQKPQENSQIPSESKTEEKSGDSAKPGKFSLPENKLLKFQVEGDLGNLDNWKAQIVLGNSSGEKGPKKGQMDDVGYVGISTVNDEIVPIARGDEHQAGYELLDHLARKGAVRSRAQDFITIFGGNNYPQYMTSDTRKYAGAVKKWLAYGGKNYPIYSQKDGGKEYVTDMQEYADLEGKLPYGSEKPSKVGREIVEGLEQTMKSIEAGDKTAFETADKVLERIWTFSSTTLDTYDDFKSDLKKGEEAKKDGNLDVLRKVMGSVLKNVSRAVNTDSFKKSRIEGMFGRGNAVKDRIMKLADEKPVSTPDRSGLTPDGEETVDTFEKLATAAKSEFGSRSLIRNSEELLRKFAGKTEDIEGLGAALDRLTRATHKEDDEEIKQALFSFNGVKNLLHNRLRQMKKDGVVKDKHFGDVSKALEEFDRLGQI